MLSQSFVSSHIVYTIFSLYQCADTICCLPLTFYVISGGYNIKTGPGCSIEQMKFDMGGSAAVLGAAKAIAQIKPPGVEVSPYLFHVSILGKDAWLIYL